MHNKTVQGAPKKGSNPSSDISFILWDPAHSFIHSLSLSFTHSFTHADTDTDTDTHTHTHTHASLSSLTDEDESLSKWSPGHNAASLCPHVLDRWEQLEESDSF